MELNMNKQTKRKYVMEIKEVPIKTNKTSTSVKYKSVEKIYTEEEVKEMIKEAIKEVTNESDI